jgi:hypothetical protein
METLMRPTYLAATLVCTALLATTPAWADASYQETTQMTGGSLLRMTHSMGMFSHSMKKLGEPMTTTVYVSGDRMARVSDDEIEIIDLGKKEMINIDRQKKTYRIETFEQMEQAAQAAAAKMQSAPQQQPQQAPAQNPNDVKLTYSFDVKETGAKQQMEGSMAREVLIVSKMNATSTTQPGEATMEMTNNVWLLDQEPAGYKEVRDFHQRMGEMMAREILKNGNPFASTPMIASKPGANDSFKGMAEQMKKLNGFSVMEITRVGATGNGEPLPPPQPGSAAVSAEQGIDVGGVAKQAAVAGATAEAGHQLSKAVPFGGAIGHFGGFGHKKQVADTNDDQAQAAAAQQQADPVLMEMVTKKANFSTSAVPSSVFEIPAGYKNISAAQ